MIKPRVCSIYRCRAKEGLYLFVDKQTGTQLVPSALMSQLGNLHLAMTLLVSQEKTLAGAEAKTVLQALDAQGYYLQMPKIDTGDADMQRIHHQNQKF